VRERVRQIQAELLAGDLDPSTARAHLLTLSSLHGNCLEEIREADAVYAAVLLKHLEANEAANRAKIRAETTPEYQRKHEARDTRELVQEMTRSLKYFLRSQEEEMRLSR